MKRLIFLKVADANPDDKKMRVTDLSKLEEKELASAYKAFRSGIQENKDIKVLKELTGLPQVIVEFPEAQYHPVHDLFHKLDVVDIIDPNLPLSEAKLKIQKKRKDKEEVLQNDADELKKLKAKMDKYKK